MKLRLSDREFGLGGETGRRQPGPVARVGKVGDVTRTAHAVEALDAAAAGLAAQLPRTRRPATGAAR